MRLHLRTLIVLALGAGLLGLFLYNVDVRGVAREIVHASPWWLAVCLLSMVLNLAIRAWRWQYLLEPLGGASFGSAFRATAVGFAASSILPARAGEVIRPYFLAQHEKMSATEAFATVILERVLDTLTVLLLLAVNVLLSRPAITSENAVAFEAVQWAGATAAAGSLGVLVVLFVLAGHPARLRDAFARLERVLPSRLAGLLARVAEKFATGLGAIRRPRRLMVALLLSAPLWLSIALGIWTASVAFHLDVSFMGSFLIVAMLVVGVAVPTPGAVGGFHAAFKYAATTFFGAADDAAVGAAIVLHAITIGTQLALGLFFAAQAGLNVAGIKELADRADRSTEPMR
jgi:uncharacterized protein (TIRG00374 family)